MSLAREWYECVRERLVEEKRCTIDCSIGFRVRHDPETAAEDECFTLGITGIHSLLTGGLAKNIIGTVTVKPTFFGAVLHGEDDIDFRFSKHILETSMHPRRMSFLRSVQMVGHLCNEPKQHRIEVSAEARRLVAVHGMPDHIASTPWSDDAISDAVARSRPLIVKGALEGWPALNWKREELANELGNVMLGHFSCRQIFGAETARFPLYTSGVRPPEELDPYFGELPFLRGKVREPYVFAGQRGGITELHCDFVDSFLVQLYGDKTFMFYPPKARDDVYAMKSFARSQHCWAQTFSPLPELHPTPGVEMLSVKVVPGDVLLIPAGWYHAARADDPTVSLGTFIFTQGEPADGYA